MQKPVFLLTPVAHGPTPAESPHGPKLTQPRRPTSFSLPPQLLVVRPKSRGSVTLRSGDPFEPPHLDAGFCSDPEGEDMQTLR